MNILKKFTLKNLKLNKKRTIVTIIGVILSTALICAVSGMFTSTQKTLVKMFKEEEGNFHICFQDISRENLKYIENNTNINQYFYSNNVGYSILEETKNDSKPYVFVEEFEKKALENSALKIIEGRMPENSNEIIISEHILTNARVDLRIGDTLNLNIGERKTLDGKILTQKDYYEKENVEEKIVNPIDKTYTIVGIIERPSNLIEPYDAPGYTIISYLENKELLEKANISVLYRNPLDSEEITKQIKEVLEENETEEIKTVVNTNLLRYEGVVGEATLKVLLIIVAVVIIIVVVSSIFVIRNSFSISVSEKTRQYGMLSSIGATKKQIKKTVVDEGIIIGAIAIPIGILVGMLTVIVLLYIVNTILGDMLNGIKFIYSVPLIPIAISVLISFITIYLSSIIPARRASKISPIEAIRGNKDIKIKSRKIRISKLTKKLFGIGGVLASKNLKRSKKKYRTTVISIVVSISIFISLSSFLEYGNRMTKMYYMDLSYNIQVYGGTEKIYKEIEKKDSIEKLSYSYSTSGIIDMDKYGTEYGKEYISVSKENAEERGMKYYNSAQIIMLDNNSFKEFIRELGLNENAYKDTVILEDDIIEYGEKEQKTIRNFYNVNSGNNINIEINGKQKEIKITKKTEKRPMGFEYCYTDGGYIFVSEDFQIDRENVHIGSMYIKSNNSTQLENELRDLVKEKEECKDLMIDNMDYYVEQSNRIILLVSIFLYGFIAVITLIGVTNIFNTITTNMILRSKEFANLKSVGMTTREFNRMIRLESILYGLKSLLIGVPTGLAGSYFIYKSFANSFDFGYIIPWTSIVISAMFVFIIISATMKYSLNKINKQNIIETIRRDNI